MASEWVMYISVVAIGVLAIAGVTLTFNAINTNTLENTVEVGLNEIVNTVAEELKNILEIGLNTDPLTRVVINRTLNLPTDLSGHSYEVHFRVLPGAKHWYVEAVDIDDPEVDNIPYETTIPWRNVTLSSAGGTGLPVIYSYETQHYMSFVRNEGSDAFRIIIW